MRFLNKFILLLLPLILFACRDEDVIYIPEEVPTGNPQYSNISGFYLLNEGNMGSNKSTLDYYDYASATYYRNIYAAANPNVPKELGDVGNDLAVYGAKLYAVINTSNKVEVMHAKDAKRIAQIDIPNCRSICFHEGFAYVTSYAGPVEINPDYSQRGFVAKIDTASLQIVDRCTVGFQPDGICVSGDNLYVCNSGGYRVPNYENTLSVISLNYFKEKNRIPIAINLNKIMADEKGRLWISSRGDYYDEDAQLIVYDTRKQRIEWRYPISVADLCADGDKLYVIGNQYSATDNSNKKAFVVIDMNSYQLFQDNFINDGSSDQIKVPYSLKINPLTKEIFVTDAKSYLNPGTLHCYDYAGIHKWQVRTGDIPAKIVFINQ